MADHLKPTIDFSRYTDRALEEAELNIDREKYPANFQAVTNQIAHRKSAGTWQPSLSNHRLVFNSESAERGILTIASYKHPFVIVFLGFWLTFWLMSEVYLVGSLFSGADVYWKDGDVASPLQLAVLTLIWSAVGTFAAGSFSWMVAGREVVIIDSQALHLTWEIFGIGFRFRRFSHKDIDGLRPTILYRTRRGGRRTPFRAIQLVTAGKSVTFAKDIELEESNSIIEKLVTLGKKQGLSLSVLSPFNER